MLYRNLSGYLKEKYGRRLSKICIDGGFSCPNRDGRVGRGGCIFCSERGSGEHIFNHSDPIGEQVRARLAQASEEELFIAYFQNFTNTYADIPTLKARYDAALIDRRIRVLAIGTRPDCIDGEVAELIASYRSRVDVWVELGLQTASDVTGELINRGYGTDTFRRAMKLLGEHGIPAVVHVMIGLPGEGDGELEDTMDLIREVDPFGVKIHSVYVARGTVLADMYARGEYEPPSLETYARRAAYAVTRLSPTTVVHRLTGDCPKDMLVAPDWNPKKSEVIAKIVENLNTGGHFQGSRYSDGEK